jgi:hypothetical protein
VNNHSHLPTVLSAVALAKVEASERRLGRHRHPHPLRPLSFAVPFIALAAILFLAFTATAQTTNGLSPAEIQGRQLAAELLSVTPATNFTQTGVLRIRNSHGTTNIPITFKTVIEPDSWRVIYSATTDHSTDYLVIVHKDGQPNEYSNSSDKTMVPFAGSDFWDADLGLEFFHWPDQKITGHETRRTRDCMILESDNPNPANGYSHVVTWIDKESLAIIYAEAYDTNNKLLKIFDPKKVKKVNGKWELEDIEIQNVQTHSRTRIRFDLNGGS